MNGPADKMLLLLLLALQAQVRDYLSSSHFLDALAFPEVRVTGHSVRERVVVSIFIAFAAFCSKIMQSTKLCKGAKVCKVEKYAGCKVMQCAKSHKVQNYAITHPKRCKEEICNKNDATHFRTLLLWLKYKVFT